MAVNYHHNINAATEVVNTIVASGGKATALRADISDEAQVMAMFEAIDPHGRAADGAGQQRRDPVYPVYGGEPERQRINRVLATNVTGYFLCCREAVKRMSHRHGGKGGAIVNVSSAASRLGAPGEYVDYAASKGAVDYPDYRAGAGGGGAGNPGQRRASGADFCRVHASGGEAGTRGSSERFATRCSAAASRKRSAQAIAWLLSDKASYVTVPSLNWRAGNNP